MSASFSTEHGLVRQNSKLWAPTNPWPSAKGCKLLVSAYPIFWESLVVPQRKRNATARTARTATSQWEGVLTAEWPEGLFHLCPKTSHGRLAARPTAQTRRQERDKKETGYDQWQIAQRNERRVPKPHVACCYGMSAWRLVWVTASWTSTSNTRFACQRYSWSWHMHVLCFSDEYVCVSVFFFYLDLILFDIIWHWYDLNWFDMFLHVVLYDNIWQSWPPWAHGSHIPKGSPWWCDPTLHRAWPQLQPGSHCRCSDAAFSQRCTTQKDSQILNILNIKAIIVL